MSHSVVSIVFFFFSLKAYGFHSVSVFTPDAVIFPALPNATFPASTLPEGGRSGESGWQQPDVPQMLAAERNFTLRPLALPGFNATWSSTLNGLREQLDALNASPSCDDVDSCEEFGVGAVDPALRKWVQHLGPAALQEEMADFMPGLEPNIRSFPDTFYGPKWVNDLRLKKLKEVAGINFCFTELYGYLDR